MDEYEVPVRVRQHTEQRHIPLHRMVKHCGAHYRRRFEYQNAAKQRNQGLEKNKREAQRDRPQDRRTEFTLIQMVEHELVSTGY